MLICTPRGKQQERETGGAIGKVHLETIAESLGEVSYYLDRGERVSAFDEHQFGERGPLQALEWFLVVEIEIERMLSERQRQPLERARASACFR